MGRGGISWPILQANVGKIPPVCRRPDCLQAQGGCHGIAVARLEQAVGLSSSRGASPFGGPRSTGAKGWLCRGRVRAIALLQSFVQ